MIALILAPSKGEAPYPPLAICSLKAWLGKYGYSSTAIDLNRKYVINHSELIYNINKYFGRPTTHLDTTSTEAVYNLDTIYNLELLLKFLYNDDCNIETLSEVEFNFYKELDAQLNIEARNLVESGYKYIGFSTFVSNICFSLLLSKKIKQLNPTIKIFFGGSSTAYKPIRDFLLKSQLADHVIVGEGENAIVKLINDLENNIAEYSVIYSDNIAPKDVSYNEVIVPTIKEIDELPFPDFSDLDLDLYTLEYNKNYRFASIATSRGCVNRCAYCSETQYWRRYRQRSVSCVIDEIEYQYNTHNMKIFFFCDSLINGNVAWLRDFCNQLIAKKIDIQWLSYVTLNNINGELLQLMHDSGCVALTFGIEHININVLTGVNKRSSIGDTKSRLLECVNSKIFPIANIIYSLPNETPEAFLELLAFTCDPDINSNVLFTFRPYEIRVGSVTTNKLMEVSECFPAHNISLPKPVIPFRDTISQLATFWNPDSQYLSKCQEKHNIMTSVYGKYNPDYLNKLNNARKYNIPSVLRKTIKLDSVPTLVTYYYTSNTNLQKFILSQIDGVHTVSDIIEIVERVILNNKNNCNIDITEIGVKNMVINALIELSQKHKILWN